MNRGSKTVVQVCEDEGVSLSTAYGWLSPGTLSTMKNKAKAKKWSAKEKLKAVSETVYDRRRDRYLSAQRGSAVVRTIFLLNYIGDSDLRRTIHAATNKSEAFNGFAQWVAFGGGGVIAENNRDEQRKVIKYNHLVSSLVIFHTGSGYLRRSGHWQSCLKSKRQCPTERPKSATGYRT